MTMSIELNGVTSYLKPAPELGDFIWRLYDKYGKEYLPTLSELLCTDDEDQMFVLKFNDGKQKYGAAFPTQYKLLDWIQCGFSDLEIEKTSEIIIDLCLIFIRVGHRCRILVTDDHRIKEPCHRIFDKEMKHRLSDKHLATEEQKNE